MNKKILTILMGLPQSGKSTWARTQGIPMVCPDTIRLALHGMPFVPSAEPFVWAIAKVMVKALFLSGHDQVILDATNTTRKRRDEWKSNDWNRDFVIFKTEVDVCKDRAGLNAELVTVIDRMEEQWEDLAVEELGIEETSREAGPVVISEESERL